MSDRLGASLSEIETEWTVEDVRKAHLALDLAEDLAILVERRLRPETPGR